MKLYEILHNMKVGEIKEITGVKDIPDGTIVQCVASNKNCSSGSDICIYRKFNVTEHCTFCDCVPTKRKDKAWICYVDITYKINSIIKIKTGMKTDKPELNLNLDAYSNYNITLDGIQYQILKEDLKKLLRLKLPTTFIEVEEGYQPIKYSMKLCTLSKLLYLRDIYRQGWTPNWNDNSNKYTILNDCGQLIKSIKSYYNRIFSFQSEEIRDKFYDNFKDMLEEIKDLI